MIKNSYFRAVKCPKWVTSILLRPRKGLTMVYAVKKFCHYLLANQFVFFVDHQALLYLVNKPCAIKRIVRWFVILLEFDFTVDVKKGNTHKRADHLSRLTNGEHPTGVDDELPDATLFQVEMVPKWSERMIQILTTAQFNDLGSDIEEKTEFIEASKRFQLLAGQLYYLGDDHIMRLVICPDDYPAGILKEAHEGSIGIHVS